MQWRHGVGRANQIAWSINEVAQILSISRSSVTRLLRSGQLPFVRVGSSRRVLDSDLAMYLNSRRSA